MNTWAHTICEAELGVILNKKGFSVAARCLLLHCVRRPAEQWLTQGSSILPKVGGQQRVLDSKIIQMSIRQLPFPINPTNILNSPHHLDMTQLQRTDIDFNLLVLCLNTLEKYNYLCIALALCVWLLWNSARSVYVSSIHLWVNANIPLTLKKQTHIHRKQQTFCSFSYLFIILETVTSLKSAIILCKSSS